MPHPDYPDTRPRCPQTGMFLPWEDEDHRPWSGRGRGHQMETNPEDYESDEYEDDEELEWDEGDDDDDEYDDDDEDDEDDDR